MQLKDNMYAYQKRDSAIEVGCTLCNYLRYVIESDVQAIIVLAICETHDYFGLLFES